MIETRRLRLRPLAAADEAAIPDPLHWAALRTDGPLRGREPNVWMRRSL